MKVSFLPDEDEGAPPGWVRKQEGNSPLGSGEAASGGAYSAADTVFEGDINEDASSASVGSDVPSPSDLSNVVESTPSPLSIADLEKRLKLEGIEAELEGSVSPGRYNEMQRLIKQYGTEEGLRRLREVDPEAARQFESDKSRPGRERLRSESPRPSEPSRDAPEGEQSEQ